MGPPPSVALIGECMIELRERPDGTLTRGFGGDVLNTAVYLRRLLGPDAEVRFATVLGDDPFSDEMISAWRDEGLNCDTVGRKSGTSAGLYLIRTDGDGERTFTYWRGQAPARRIMTQEWAALVEPAFRSAWIYLSGITLAILDDGSRERLLERLAAARAHGATIAFDGNFRPALWDDPAAAARWHDRVWRLCGLALAGAEDEARIFGDASPQRTMQRLVACGVPEIVVKMGDDGVMTGFQGEVRTIPIQPAAEIVDTTAAGDSFNAAYLAGRMTGADPVASAKMGAVLAAEVIRHAGAIIPATAMPDFRVDPR